MQKHIVIGYGEVGKAIASIFGAAIHDPQQGMKVRGIYDVMHVCIPYFDGFVHCVQQYQKKFKPVISIVHSTVPVGTCGYIPAVHSPIRGVHPHLEEGIYTFTKYFGGENAEDASKPFKEKGIKTRCVADSGATEAAKLWSTTQYGLYIAMNKWIHGWCEENKVDFDIVYTEFNQTYNAGYTKLGKRDVTRPVLKYMEGEIGGHCVMQNLTLLDDKFFCDIIKEVNKGETPNDS